jgi:hypothetical protein
MEIAKIVSRIMQVVEISFGIWFLWFVARRVVQPFDTTRRKTALVLILTCLLGAPISVVVVLLAGALFKLSG